jgi:hypothetical protein
MAVRAQQRQIIEPVVTPIAINVLDFHGDAARFRMTLGPAALRTLFAETLDKETPNELIAAVR